MPPILQKITVPYEYPVYFTGDVFAPANPDLVEALAAEGAVAPPPGVRRRRARRGRRLAGAGGRRRPLRRAPRRPRSSWWPRPWIVEGGEAVKNDPASLSALQTALHELGSTASRSS